MIERPQPKRKRLSFGCFSCAPSLKVDGQDPRNWCDSGYRPVKLEIIELNPRRNSRPEQGDPVLVAGIGLTLGPPAGRLENWNERLRLSFLVPYHKVSRSSSSGLYF